MIHITVVFLIFCAISLCGNDNFHFSKIDVGNDLIGIISTISQQYFCQYSFNQMKSFFVISSGTLCNKYSDWYTICIYGKINFGIDLPFVRFMSWLPPFAPTACGCTLQYNNLYWSSAIQHQVHLLKIPADFFKCLDRTTYGNVDTLFPIFHSVVVNLAILPQLVKYKIWKGNRKMVKILKE